MPNTCTSLREQGSKNAAKAILRLEELAELVRNFGFSDPQVKDEADHLHWMLAAGIYFDVAIEKVGPKKYQAKKDLTQEERTVKNRVSRVMAFLDSIAKGHPYLKMDPVFLKSSKDTAEYIQASAKELSRLLVNETQEKEVLKTVEPSASGGEVVYQKEGGPAKDPILELITKGESGSLEFKETLEYHTQQKGKDKDVLLSSLKTIAGFLNAESGTMLIGVDDSGKIRGIEQDLSLMKSGNTDRFEQKIRNWLKDRFKPHPIGKIQISFEKFSEGTICRVNVQKSKEIIHLDNDVYVRDGNTTQKLGGPALTDWIQQRKELTKS